jgi:hypothetical protein
VQGLGDGSYQVSLVYEGPQSVLSEANECLLSKYSCDILFVSSLSLFLACLLLYLPPVELLLPSDLGSLESLCLNKLSIPDLLILLLLILHDPELFVFKDEHACLLECLPHEDVEHGLDLGVEVKQVRVLLEDLSALAVFLRGHLRLEKGHGGTIQIELSRHSLLLLRRLVCQNFNVFFCLDVHVNAPWHWLWGRDVSVWIDVARSIRSAAHLYVLIRMTVTYSSSFFES